MKSIGNLNSGSNSRRIARNVFIGFAGFNGFIAVLIGVFTLVNMQGIFESFGITFTRELNSIGLPAAGLLILVGVLVFISIYWLLQGKIEGIMVPLGHAVFLFALGFMALARLGTTDILLVDSIRGFLAMIAGYFAYQEMRHG